MSMYFGRLLRGRSLLCSRWGLGSAAGAEKTGDVRRKRQTLTKASNRLSIMFFVKMIPAKLNLGNRGFEVLQSVSCLAVNEQLGPVQSGRNSKTSLGGVLQ